MRINDSPEFFRMWLEPLAIGSYSVYRGRIWKLVAWDTYVDMWDDVGRHWTKLMFVHGKAVIKVKLPDKHSLEEMDWEYLDVVPRVDSSRPDGSVLVSLAGCVDWSRFCIIQEEQ